MSSLLAKPESIEQQAVPVAVRLAQVIQQLAATAHHSQQPATGMMVFYVGLEMIGQVVDARGKQCDLHFGRAGVGLRPLMFLQNLSPLARRYRHYSVSERKADILPAESGV